MQPILYVVVNIMLKDDRKDSIEIMSEKNWAEEEADRILREETERNQRTANHQHKNDVFNQKVPELWSQLYQMMQRDIDAFNNKFPTDDHRRIVMNIKGNVITAQRQNNYPLTELFIEVIPVFHRIDYRTRLKHNALHVEESLTDVANSNHVYIQVDDQDNLNFYHDNAIKLMKHISPLILKELIDAR